MERLGQLSAASLISLSIRVQLPKKDRDGPNNDARLIPKSWYSVPKKSRWAVYNEGKLSVIAVASLQGLEGSYRFRIGILRVPTKRSKAFGFYEPRFRNCDVSLAQFVHVMKFVRVPW
jgi:hypothetical protein